MTKRTANVRRCGVLILCSPNFKSVRHYTINAKASATGIPSFMPKAFAFSFTFVTFLSGNLSSVPIGLAGELSTNAAATPYLWQASTSIAGQARNPFEPVTIRILKPGHFV